MSTHTRPMTAEDLLRHDEPNGRIELVRGELVVMSFNGGLHGMVAANILYSLGRYVEEHGLGETYPGRTGFHLRRDPDTVRSADACFVSHRRLALDDESDGYFPFAPDLVVEVISWSNPPQWVAGKLGDWLDAGAQLVWWIDTDRREVVEHRPGVGRRTLAEDEELDGGDVVPGFRCRIADLFE